MHYNPLGEYLAALDKADNDYDFRIYGVSDRSQSISNIADHNINGTETIYNMYL